MRPPVIGRKLGRRKRPAAMLDPGAMAKIDRIERAAPPAPGVSIAAEIADLTDIEIKIGQSGVGAFVERLGGPSEVDAAAFQDAQLDLAARELARERDPGRPG